MKFAETEIPGAFVVELEPVADERGSFARVWCEDELGELGLNPKLAQASVSRNVRAGTLRGLHYQRAPNEEAKLVRCLRGALFDVVVDLRPDSPAFMRWFGVELDEESGKGLYIPEGCAHGFQTLVDDTTVLYFISQRYEPQAADGVRWDDPAFAVQWPPAAERTISGRDRAWPDFRP